MAKRGRKQVPSVVKREKGTLRKCRHDNALDTVPMTGSAIPPDWLEEPELEEEVVNERCYHRYGLRHPFSGVFFKDTPRGVVSQDDPGLF